MQLVSRERDEAPVHPQRSARLLDVRVTPSIGWPRLVGGQAEETAEVEGARVHGDPSYDLPLTRRQTIVECLSDGRSGSAHACIRLRRISPQTHK